MEFTNPSQILAAVLKKVYFSKKTKNPSFSLRAFARQLEMQPSSLSEIMRNKRNVSREFAIRLLERLPVGSTEKELVVNNFKKSGCNRSFSAPTYSDIAMDQYRLISEWFHFAILSLAKTNNFSESPAWISRRLGLSAGQARQALSLLKSQGLLNKTGRGKCVTTGKNFRSPDGISNEVLKSAHSRNLELAELSLYRNSIEKRDFTAITMAIDPSRIESTRRKIRMFRDSVSANLEKGNKSEVYKLCIQLFPLTLEEKP